MHHGIKTAVLFK